MLLNLINLISKGRSHMLLSHISNARNRDDSEELSKNEEEKLSTYKDQISELKSEIQLPYYPLSKSPNDQKFSKHMRGLDNGYKFFELF